MSDTAEPKSAARAGARLGTRFLVFPQPPFVPGYERPEVVWLSVAPGEVRAGPQDRRMYVASPTRAKRPYRYPDLPPLRGPRLPPVEPGPDGHFDHLDPASEDFLAAHVYACVRRVLDVCESWLGRPVPWFFEPTYDRLEIVPVIPGWENAHSGFGFLEMGETAETGRPFPHALNFDAIAHETGHLILMGIAGTPRGKAGPDFFAYHEAAADMVALLGLLQFDTAMDRILRRTRGNLLVHNELDRFAEISDERRIRSFSNSLKLSDVGSEVHDRSKPFAGALFDALVEIHQTLAYERGLSGIDPRAFRDLRRELSDADIRGALGGDSGDYALRHFGLKGALAEARDVIGEALLGSWPRLDPDTLDFATAAEAFLEAASRGRARTYVAQIEDCFAWRQII
ncbi:hypothetical protein [uncultured Alsobacter sp.]|uniref:hypothetical protein n=1 Tax=uncultured Alsobacter sp. TaxID=1748258 RepID=UPI0025EC8D2D|nr:hypothetical protein [uncultured Alsobacter sp.]